MSTRIVRSICDLDRAQPRRQELIHARVQHTRGVLDHVDLAQLAPDPWTRTTLRAVLLDGGALPRRLAEAVADAAGRPLGDLFDVVKVG